MKDGENRTDEIKDEKRNAGSHIGSVMLMDAMGDIDEDLLKGADRFRGGKRKKKVKAGYIALPLAGVAVLALAIVTVGKMGMLMPKGAAESAMVDGAYMNEACDEAAIDSGFETDSFMEEVCEAEPAVTEEADLGTVSGDDIKALAQYTGNVDEAYDWPYYTYFEGIDIDSDGKTDHIYRKYDAQNDTAKYSLNLGNGNVVEIVETYSYALPYIVVGDECGYEKDDLVFRLTYDSEKYPAKAADEIYVISHIQGDEYTVW
ncbi:MAG: hypothetical protein K5669_06605 [Lachnospiraceae bacterium]|nr:hypothetical protein [Lachnospiraceae bacterium]